MSAGAPLDVVVAGGGMAGAATSLDLARRGFSVTLVDHPAPATPGDEYGLRVSSINLRSEASLRRLGAWPAIARGRLSPFDRICVWEHDTGHELVFDAADAGVGHLAHILENDLVTAALHRCLRDAAGYVPAAPGRVESFARRGEMLEVSTSAGEVLRCRLLVGADGAASRVRALAGIDSRVFDYRQRAVVARVKCEQEHGGIARQVFLPTGPLAFLPLADGTCSIVWSLDPAGAAEMLALDDAAFRAALERSFESRLGRVLDTGPRAAFPLKRMHATRYHAGHVALVGDACHTVHPLAGLGANQGIADAEALAAVLDRARERGQDFASARTLGAYQRRRRPVNSATLATMDVFHFIFANDSAALSRIRARALGLVDSSRFARGFFVRQACGLAP